MITTLRAKRLESANQRKQLQLWAHSVLPHIWMLRDVKATSLVKRSVSLLKGEGNSVRNIVRLTFTYSCQYRRMFSCSSSVMAYASYLILSVKREHCSAHGCYCKACRCHSYKEDDRVTGWCRVFFSQPDHPGPPGCSLLSITVIFVGTQGYVHLAIYSSLGALMTWGFGASQTYLLFPPPHQYTCSMYTSLSHTPTVCCSHQSLLNTARGYSVMCRPVMGRVLSSSK